VENKNKLPKRAVAYIHDMGVRALDHLSENFSEDSPAAVQTLVGHWKSMNAEEKSDFVSRVATSVVEVVAASAALPVGLKLGKKVVKATSKVIRKKTKKLKKEVKKLKKASKAKAKAS